MLESIIYFSPFVALLIGIIVLLFQNYLDDENRVCFKITRICLFVSLTFSILFYNKSASYNLLSADLFSLLFIIVTFFATFTVLFLSRKWYSSLNISGNIFCSGLLFAVLSCMIIISSKNLAITCVGYTLMILSNFIMYKNADKRKEISLSGQVYILSALISWGMLILSTFIFYKQSGSLYYEDLLMFLSTKQNNFMIYGAASLAILSFIFLFGLAPLHFWFTETMGQIILPIFTYFILVPVAAYMAGFINFNVKVLWPILEYFELFYLAIALISIGIGAVGACSGKNLRKIFAYSSVYHFGIIFLMLRYFDYEGMYSSLIYMFTYLLAMSGICASLFGIKSKGEYLFMLTDYEGAAHKRPYISAVLSIFLFSLLGIPPFLGFLGVFSVLNNLVSHDNFYQLVYLLIMMVVLLYSYLQIIKTLYFEKSKKYFDRADIGIYMAILIDVIIMIWIMLKPQNLFGDLNSILEVVLG